MRRSTRFCIVSPGCLAMADRLVCGTAFCAVPVGSLVVPAGVVAWLPVGWAKAGAATSIVVISSGAARRASIIFMAGFSIVRLAADAT